MPVVLDQNQHADDALDSAFNASAVQDLARSRDLADFIARRQQLAQAGQQANAARLQQHEQFTASQAQKARVDALQRAMTERDVNARLQAYRDQHVANLQATQERLAETNRAALEREQDRRERLLNEAGKTAVEADARTRNLKRLELADTEHAEDRKTIAADRARNLTREEAADAERARRNQAVEQEKADEAARRASTTTKQQSTNFQRYLLDSGKTSLETLKPVIEQAIENGDLTAAQGAAVLARHPVTNLVKLTEARDGMGQGGAQDLRNMAALLSGAETPELLDHYKNYKDPLKALRDARDARLKMLPDPAEAIQALRARADELTPPPLSPKQAAANDVAIAQHNAKWQAAHPDAGRVPESYDPHAEAVQTSPLTPGTGEGKDEWEPPSTEPSALTMPARALGAVYENTLGGAGGLVRSRLDAVRRGDVGAMLNPMQALRLIPGKLAERQGWLPPAPSGAEALGVDHAFNPQSQAGSIANDAVGTLADAMTEPGLLLIPGAGRLAGGALTKAAEAARPAAAGLDSLTGSVPLAGRLIPSVERFVNLADEAGARLQTGALRGTLPDEVLPRPFFGGKGVGGEVGLEGQEMRYPLARSVPEEIPPAEAAAELAKQFAPQTPGEAPTPAPAPVPSPAPPAPAPEATPVQTAPVPSRLPDEPLPQPIEVTPDMKGTAAEADALAHNAALRELAPTEASLPSLRDAPQSRPIAPTASPAAIPTQEPVAPSRLPEATGTKAKAVAPESATSAESAPLNPVKADPEKLKSFVAGAKVLDKTVSETGVFLVKTALDGLEKATNKVEARAALKPIENELHGGVNRRHLSVLMDMVNLPVTTTNTTTLLKSLLNRYPGEWPEEVRAPREHT